MKHITKGKEPEVLRKYRMTTEGACYDGFGGRKEVKEALLEEQGDICAYCMSRISADKMKIEHWKCQTDFKELDLDYKNLLGVCEGKNGPIEYCDTSKGSELITINPVDKRKNCEKLIKYRGNGKIYSDDKQIHKDLNDTLNLNNQTLETNRKKAWKFFSDHLGRQVKGAFSKKIIEKNIETLHKPNKKGKLRPYCQMLIYFLAKKLRSLEKQK